MTNQSTTHHFDVFLCHNSQEKKEVEQIRLLLRQRGIYAWLDKYGFEPFRPWQDQLEEIIPQVKAAAIFLGASGIGPWANVEMREFLVEFAQRQIRMGLVILPSCSDELIQSVPRFLRIFPWVDFRQTDPDPMEQLIWGITGQRPTSSPIAPSPSQSSARSSDGGRVAGERNKGERNKSRIAGHRSFAYMDTPSPPASADDNLISERGIDYRKL